MSVRMKKQVLTGVTSEQMELAFSEYATADARITKMRADMEMQIAEIREKYADNIVKYTEMKDKSFYVMQVYATENKAKLFKNKKSVNSVYGIFGFRTGTPKLKTLKGFTWPAVTNLLKEFLPGYVRVFEEPAKDMLLAERNNPDVAAWFDKVGVFVDQDECFYVERKGE
ncbi:MAG: host-nuclease inhibitor Gam family protein [Candidatus Azobacteroides sp.]|nr:host-nuclease inhibitor Gam family protein [Candidatus Azobacteroides sp.]